jgi:methylthioribose-1-phosphate isomerase
MSAPAVSHPVAVRWSDDGHAVELLDQTLLPGSETYVRIESAAAMAAAIRALQVRGAPAIGVAAALGLAVEMARWTALPHDAFVRVFDSAHSELRSARPTAANLAWAVDRLRRLLASLGTEDTGVIACKLYGEASAIMSEDIAACRAMARYAYDLLPASGAVRALTVCNAGALATAGMGTALAPLYHALDQGRDVHVFACETRPLLQGSRITAWELERAGIDVTVLVDAAAPLLLRDRAVDIVLSGADRIAANGDVANKIGTYSLAVHAHRAGIPFIVVAPGTTLDPAAATGDDIQIEHRAADVHNGFGMLTAPPNTRVFAPAFDITPAALITAIVTDRGVWRPGEQQ